MGNSKIDPLEILDTIDRSLKEIKDEIKSGRVEKEDLQAFGEGFDEVYFMALKIKTNITIDIFLEKNPDVSPQEILRGVLGELPDNIDVNMLKDLTAYIFSEWEKRKLKIAA